MKYLGIFAFILLFFSLKWGYEDSVFVYKKIPQEYVNRKQSLATPNLITKELLDSSYPITRSLPLHYDTTGKTDYTDIIQSVLDKHRIVTFPNFPLLIDSKGLNISSDSKVIFEKGSVLILKANNKENYEILKLREVHNVSLYSPNIIGDRRKHLGTSGEWGFGISIKGSQKIKIYKAVIKDCWGDGIYLGSYNVLVNTDILIKDCFLDNNRRNGISIISGIDVTIDNSLISNTNGTAPMSGIDIEPNTNDEFLENININTTTTFNNENNGILIVLRLLQGNKTKKISVNLKSHIDDSSNNAMGFALTNSKNDLKEIEGSINVVSSVWKNNKADLVYFHDFSDNGINLNFIKPKIVNKDAAFSKNKIVELKNKCKRETKFSYAE